MVRISDLSGLRHIITALELKEDEMLVQFSSPKFPMLKVGSKLAIDGYSLAGDEWGIGASFDALKIDGRIQIIQVEEQVGSEQPATRSESKSEGGDKPQPKAEGRSR
jgi:hypothetical protein